MVLLISRPDCARIGAKTVEKEDISPDILLWRVWLDIYPNVPRPMMVLVIAVPDCARIGAKTVEKEDISPDILLWRVWLDT